MTNRHFFGKSEFFRKEESPAISVFKKQLQNECIGIRKLRIIVLKDFIENVVAKNIGDFEPGAYKLVLKPDHQEGSPYISIYPQMRFSDINAFKIFKDETSGIFLISYRSKDPFSLVDTLHREIGAKPLINFSIKYIDEQRASSIISNKKSKISRSNSIKNKDEKEQELQILLSYLEDEKNERTRLLEQSCIQPKTLEDLDKKLMSIRSIIISINSLKRNQNFAVKIKRFPIDAASHWPISASVATELLKTADSQQLSYITEGLQKYVLAMKSSMGVALLEYSSYDLMRDIEYTLQRISHYYEGHHVFESQYYSVLGTLRLIHEQIAKIDKKMTNLSSKIYYSAEDFISVCELGEMRADLLKMLKSLYKSISKVSHKREVLNHLKMIIATMAANLCKVLPSEYGLWEQFYSSGQLSALLSSYQQRHKSSTTSAISIDEAKVESSVLLFISKSKEEWQKIKDMKQNSSKSPYEYSGKSKELEAKLASEISSLSDISPLAYFILSEAYIDSKTHLEYKFGGMLCKDPYYYLNSSDLLLASLMLSPPDKKKHYLDLLSQKVERNAQLFGLFEKYGLREEIFAQIEPFLYLKEKAFDLESNPFAKVEKGYRGKSIEVTYKTAVENGDQYIIYQISNIVRKVKIPPPTYDSSFEKTGKEVLYGDKFDLDFVLQKDNVSRHRLPDIYVAIFNSIPKDFSLFFKIQQSLRSEDLSTSYFISTFSKSNFGGYFSNIGETPPAFLESSYKNTLLEGIKSHYSNYRTESGELVDFFLDKMKLRIFRELNRSINYWAVSCSRSIMKNQQSKT
ncbi:MAG: hypothetical protein N3G80_01305 [Candidatus Micrarchaeota archaeon]|nr:hypothetical protein [Candidatus Micrarchaeota archaeon]